MITTVTARSGAFDFTEVGAGMWTALCVDTSTGMHIREMLDACKRSEEDLDDFKLKIISERTRHIIDLKYCLASNRVDLGEVHVFGGETSQISLTAYVRVK